MSSGISEQHLFLRAMDTDERLFLVERALFTTAGNVPPSSWFARHFGSSGGMRPPTPLGHVPLIPSDPATLRAPVYLVPVPYTVLAAFVPLLQSHELREKALDRRSMEMDRREWREWRHYVTYYGLVPPPPLLVAGDAATKKRKLDVADMSPEEVVLAKRARITAAEAQTPRLRYLRRCAEALTTAIVANHPDWAAFLAGSKSSVCCHYINSYRRGPDGDLTHRIEAPDEDIVVDDDANGISVAHVLGYSLPANGTFPSPSRAYVAWCMEQVLDPAGDGRTYQVQLSMHTTRKSRAKFDIKTQFWPAGRQELTPGAHDVLAIQISRATPHDRSFASFLSTIDVNSADEDEDDEDGDEDSSQ